ncbi:hypothetical protein VNO78_33222 [Psophocarpus tetragonolobus]|uniref:Uncharacterized protein n=1 Tax=Psophocarpus tetragonolobus TaxID=3891 RepID=A0AAN9P0Q7_PSOTE
MLEAEMSGLPESIRLRKYSLDFDLLKRIRWRKEYVGYTHFRLVDLLETIRAHRTKVEEALESVYGGTFLGEK